MSTCPDKSLYSAYVDDEVPSPWKEKLESHISVCPQCQKKIEKYKGLKSALRVNTPSLSTETLEASFAKICAYRTQVQQAQTKNNNHNLSGWFQLSVRMPLPILAAILLVAIVFPSVIVATNIQMTNKTLVSAPPVTTGTQVHLLTTDKTPKAQLSVYSPDLPVSMLHSGLIGYTTNKVFTMVNFANQFTTDTNVFDSANILIIKLPNLTHFSNVEFQLLSEEEPRQEAVSFFK